MSHTRDATEALLDTLTGRIQYSLSPACACAVVLSKMEACSFGSNYLTRSLLACRTCHGRRSRACQVSKYQRLVGNVRARRERRAQVIDKISQELKRISRSPMLPDNCLSQGSGGTTSARRIHKRFVVRRSSQRARSPGSLAFGGK